MGAAGGATHACPLGCRDDSLAREPRGFPSAVAGSAILRPPGPGALGMPCLGCTGCRAASRYAIAAQSNELAPALRFAGWQRKKLRKAPAGGCDLQRAARAPGGAGTSEPAQNLGVSGSADWCCASVVQCCSGLPSKNCQGAHGHAETSRCAERGRRLQPRLGGSLWLTAQG